MFRLKNKIPTKTKVISFSTLVFVILLINLIPSSFSPTFLKRIILYRESDVYDYKIFPSRSLHKSSEPFIFPNGEKLNVNEKFKNISYLSNKKEKKIGDLENFLKESATTSFIIIKDDKLVYEKYFNGYQRDSINTSVSMAKSYTSALVGIAIDEGLIKSIDDPITKYLPELNTEDFGETTIKDLLTMTSQIKYVEGPLFFGDDATTYYSDDLRKLALNISKKSGDKEFLYNNYHPLLLGMIIERVTKQSVTEYLDNKIWKEIGTEFDGSWSLDSEYGFEKMESGVNARSIDFAKFGRLFLNKGKLGSKQIISENWIEESTKGIGQNAEFYSSLKNWNVDLEKTTYGYLWWNYKRDSGGNDFYARGKYGQYIYVSPETNTVIVRNGIDTGEVDFWPEILFQITNL